jgi:hypothetical protein
MPKEGIVATEFPCFIMDGKFLTFVKQFKYLEHDINDSLTDDNDMKREICNLFMRSNIVIRRYGKC